MKPKHVREKLVIFRETVSNLNYLEQSQVKGGYISYSCPELCTTSADPRCTDACPTEDIPCMNTTACYTTGVEPCGTTVANC